MEKENKTQILLYRNLFLVLLKRRHSKLLYTHFLYSNPFLSVMFTFPALWSSNIIDNFSLVWVEYCESEALDSSTRKTRMWIFSPSLLLDPIFTCLLTPFDILLFLHLSANLWWIQIYCAWCDLHNQALVLFSVLPLKIVLSDMWFFKWSLVSSLEWWGLQHQSIPWLFIPCPYSFAFYTPASQGTCFHTTAVLLHTYFC